MGVFFPPGPGLNTDENFREETCEISVAQGWRIQASAPFMYLPPDLQVCRSLLGGAMT